jgi:hypothetical protein
MTGPSTAPASSITPTRPSAPSSGPSTPSQTASSK